MARSSCSDTFNIAGSVVAFSVSSMAREYIADAFW
jgi:hypothetical protein